VLHAITTKPWNRATRHLVGGLHQRGAGHGQERYDDHRPRRDPAVDRGAGRLSRRGRGHRRRGRPGHPAGSLPGRGDDDDLDEIAWEDFFAKFEEAKLAFLYEDEPENRFSKFVRRKGD
jgi:hypothetical protein